MTPNTVYLVEERIRGERNEGRWTHVYVSVNKAKADVDEQARREDLGPLRWEESAGGVLIGQTVNNSPRSYKIVSLGVYRDNEPHRGSAARQFRKAAIAVFGMIVAAVISVFVVAGVPRVLNDSRQFIGPDRWQPTTSDWSPVQQTTIRTGADGFLQLTTPAGNMRWFGAFLADPRLCNYGLTLDARSPAQQGVMAYGYGIAPGASVDAGGIPHGAGVQYDHEFGGLRYPDYPSDSADYPGGYIDVETFFLDGKRIPVDDRWHHWIINVRGTTATVYLDNHEVRSLQLTATCTGGIYLRVWNGTAEFRNIIIKKL